MLDTYVDKTYIVNLDSRSDRWELIQEEFKRIGLKNYERFPAIRPKLDNYPKEYYDKLTLAGADKNKYAISALGNKLSHVEIMKRALAKGYKQILLLEDDAQFCDNFSDRILGVIDELEKQKWGMFCLGANHKDPPISVSEKLLKITCAYTTHAYILNDIMMHTIIVGALKSGKENDVYYAETIHSMKTTFCPKDPLCWQRPGYSDVLNGARDYKVLRKIYS